jgi:hypothetical protein
LAISRLTEKQILAAQEKQEQRQQQKQLQNTISNNCEAEYDGEENQQKKHAGHQRRSSISRQDSLPKDAKKQQVDTRNNGNIKAIPT